MRFVPVEDGVRLAVEDLGPGPDAAGDHDPVILLAGLGLSHEVWDRQVRLLTRNRRVVCVDQRGHGRSDKPLKGYSLGRLAADLVAVLNRLRITRCDIVGWSFGGQVAFCLAAKAPQRVGQLVLVGSNGVRASRSERFPFGTSPIRLERALVEAEHADRVTARRQAIASGFAGDPPLGVLDFLLELSLRMPLWTALECYHSMITTDMVDLLPNVTAPTLQVMGSADPVQSIEGAYWLQDRLAHPRLVQIPECGHYPMFEAPDAFDEALLSFLGAP